jgi:DUF4097 and DUF4098 domain-containing protein YvlB
MNQHFHTPHPVELYVELGRGRIAVTATETDESTVTVSGERADEVVVEHRDDRLTVVGPRQTGFLGGSTPRLDVTITVPTSSTLTVKAGSADTQATGSYAGVWASSGSGDVTVDVVDGVADLQSGSGDVKAAEIRGDGRIKSGSGDVDVRRTGSALTVSTGSGDVRIGTTGGALAIKTGSGDVRVGESGDDVSFSTGSGDLEVDVARRGRLLAKGASGDVHIGIPAGTPVWTDISTVTGRVSSDLQGVGEPAEGQDHVEIRTKSASGSITLQQR